MALLMFDGFEPYGSTAEVIAGGNWKAPGFALDTKFRTGSRSVRVYSNNSLITKDFLDPAMLICGAGVAYDDLLVEQCMAFRGDQGNLVATLEKTADAGTLVVKDGAGTTLFTSGEIYTATEQFHYVEMKVHVNGASGQIALQVNGSLLYDSGAIDIQAGSSTGIREVEFGEGTLGVDRMYVDDVYVCDDSGTSHNDFLGPVRIALVVPTSDASVTWSPDSGTTNYTQVDDIEAGHDGDTTYVSTATVGDKDLYGMADLAAELSSPVALQLFYGARHDDSSGGAAVAPVLLSGATEDEGSQVALSSQHQLYASGLYDVDPDTGAEWTQAGVNGAQVGVVFKANL